MKPRICDHCGAKMTAIKTDKKTTVANDTVQSIETYLFRCPKCGTELGPVQETVLEENKNVRKEI